MKSSKIYNNQFKNKKALTKENLIEKASMEKSQTNESPIEKASMEKNQTNETQDDKVFLEKTANSLQNLQKLFFDFLTHTKKFSPHSLRAYKKDLESLFNQNSCCKKTKLLKNHSYQNKPYINNSNNSNQNSSLSAKELEQKIKYLVQENMNQNPNWKNSTRSRKLASVRTFIKWLANEKYLKEDFRHLFKSPKISRHIPLFLSVDEVLVITDMFQKKNSISAEDKALFFLIYGGGLRVSEACKIKNKDIDWSSKTLKITGKGGKQRLVFLPEYAFSFLSDIRSVHIYFFGEKPLSERKAYDKIKRIGQLAGFSKALHPHALRHSFATHMLTGGSEIRVLQELLGHKSLTATQKYTHLDLAYLDKTLEKFHPINKDLKLLKK